MPGSHVSNASQPAQFAPGLLGGVLVADIATLPLDLDCTTDEYVFGPVANIPGAAVPFADFFVAAFDASLDQDQFTGSIGSDFGALNRSDEMNGDDSANSTDDTWGNYYYARMNASTPGLFFFPGYGGASATGPTTRSSATNSYGPIARTAGGSSEGPAPIVHSFDYHNSFRTGSDDSNSNDHGGQDNGFNPPNQHNPNPDQGDHGDRGSDNPHDPPFNFNPPPPPVPTPEPSGMLLMMAGLTGLACLYQLRRRSLAHVAR